MATAGTGGHPIIPRTRTGLALCLVALLAAACGESEEYRWSLPPPAASAGSGGMAGSPSLPEPAAVPGAMRLLSGAEYAATVGDVLGTSTVPPLPDDPDYFGSFDNVAGSRWVAPEFLEIYLSAAEQVAQEVLSSNLKEQVVTCQSQDDAACVRSIIAGIGLRLFRRPLLEEEFPIYERVYERARTRGELHDAAIGEVLIALLSSAQFLYRIEFVGSEPGTQPIGPYEIATRLSYLLWSSAPDEALLQAAENAELSQDAELEAQVARMWEDPKSQRFVDNFAGQWLGARQMRNHYVDPVLFPEWSGEVASAAGREILEYFAEFVRQDLDWLDFFRSRTHYVDAGLGGLYGVQLASDGTQRITIEEGERVGYLGLVGFLTATSQERRTSPTRRGRFVLENLLCSPLPPPSPSIPALVPDDPTQPRTTREAVENISREPECAYCHMLMDPIGLALDGYDAIGRFRTTYPDGRLIDVSDMLWDGTPVQGLSGVSEWLTQEPRSQACLVEKLYSYALGRVPDETDAPNVEALTGRWREGPLTIKRAVSQIVLATPFRFRSDGGQP